MHYNRKKEKLHITRADIIYILIQLEPVLDAKFIRTALTGRVQRKGARASLETIIIVCINGTIESHRVGLRNYFDVGDEVRQFIFDPRADRLEIDLSSTTAAYVLPLRDKGGVIYRRLHEQIFKQRVRRNFLLRSSDVMERRIWSR